jgi:hypothetical protein
VVRYQAKVTMKERRLSFRDTTSVKYPPHLTLHPRTSGGARRHTYLCWLEVAKPPSAIDSINHVVWTGSAERDADGFNGSDVIIRARAARGELHWTGRRHDAAADFLNAFLAERTEFAGYQQPAGGTQRRLARHPAQPRAASVDAVARRCT